MSKEKNIEEGRKIIAEYMGIPVLERFSTVTNEIHYYYYNHDESDYESLPDYTSDLNCIIPVLSKLLKDNPQLKNDISEDFINEIISHLNDKDIVNSENNFCLSIFNVLLKYIKNESNNSR